jgi:hypothetical protein
MKHANSTVLAGWIGNFVLVWLVTCVAYIGCVRELPAKRIQAELGIKHLPFIKWIHLPSIIKLFYATKQRCIYDLEDDLMKLRSFC